MRARRPSAAASGVGGAGRAVGQARSAPAARRSPRWLTRPARRGWRLPARSGPATPVASRSALLRHLAPTARARRSAGQGRRPVGQLAPDVLGENGHQRVQQAQVAIEHPGQRRPDGALRCGRRLGSLSPILASSTIPVAEVAPDRVVQQPRRPRRTRSRHRPVDGSEGRAQRSRIQCSAGPSWSDRGSPAARRPAISAGRMLEHETRRVPDLVGEVARALETGRDSFWSAPAAGPWTQREAQRVGAQSRRSLRADRRTLPLVLDILAPNGSRTMPCR